MDIGDSMSCNCDPDALYSCCGQGTCGKPADSTEEAVQISRKEYDRLLARDEWLSALEQAGVDNWGGVEVAFDIMENP